MRKIYVLCALMATTGVFAQTSIEFEGHLTEVDTFDNGQDGNGAFVFNSVSFENVYNTQFEFFTGFAVSSMTDDTTAGFTNQYSSIAAGGSGSRDYMIYYSSGSIDFTDVSGNIQLESVDITNTTYAAISMRDGDGFAKQFGSPNGPDGNPDGTNGEDYFILHMYSVNLAGDTIGHIEFNLADFRFADNAQDYIVQDWETVDLSDLNVAGEVIAYVQFGFESSDNGQFGMNTPAYFAMDDLTYSTTAGLEQQEMVDAVYPNPFKNTLNLPVGVSEAKIFSLSGQLVLNQLFDQDTAWDVTMLPAGVYLLVLETPAGTTTQKIIK